MDPHEIPMPPKSTEFHLIVVKTASRRLLNSVHLTTLCRDEVMYNVYGAQKKVL